MGRVEPGAPAFEREQRRAAQPVVRWLEPLGVALADPPCAALETGVRAIEPGAQLGQIGTTSRPATDGVEARTSAARSTSGVSCSWPTADDDRHRAGGDRPHEPLVGEREQILEAAAAAGDDHDTSTPRAQSSSIAAAIDGCGARALDVGLGDEDVRRREARRDRGQHVALGRGVVAGHEPDQPRDPRQRPLALGGEEALGRELLLQPLERREVGAEPEALDRERAQVEVAALLVELRPAVDVHALAVGEVEPQRVELAARHLDRQAGAALRVLEREEDGRPALLPAQLGHLALDPDGRQPLEPRGDPLVERAHGEDLAPVDLGRLDLHGRASALEQDLGGGLVRAAGEDELDRVVQVGLGVRDLLRELGRVAGLDQHVQPPRHDLLVL